MCFNDDAKDAHIDCTCKAIKFYTRGKLGDRINKQTGILEVVDNKNNENIRGSILIDTIIIQTIQITNEVITMNTTNDVKDNIYTYLAEDVNHFDTVRQTEKI